MARVTALRASIKLLPHPGPPTNKG